MKQWTLTDDQPTTYIEAIESPPGTLGGAAAAIGFEKKRLSGGLSQGVDVIRVENGKLSFVVVPTRGMSLHEARLDDLRFGWRSPVRGPVHPSFVDLGEPSGLGWLDGFDELLVRCGLESNGAPEFDEETGRLVYPLHGRIGNRPAHRVSVTIDESTGRIDVQGVVEECRFHFLKLRMTSTISTTPNADHITVVDRIENLSASPAEFQLLYHCNFGAPLLDAGSTVVAPASEVAPRNERAASGVANWNHFAAEQAGFEEQVYFARMAADADGQTQVLLKNAHSTQGAVVRYNVSQLPCFTLWKNTTALADGYVTGLEPGVNYPNPRSFEGKQGRVGKLGPGESSTFEVTLRFLNRGDDVEAAESEIHKLRSEAPTLHVEAPEGWTA